MCALVVYIAVGAVGLMLGCGTYGAAAREFPTQPAKRRNFVLAALILFSALLTVNFVLGTSGTLSRFDRLPPPFFLFFLFILAASFSFAFSRFGDLLVKHLSLRALVGFHAFRALAELVLLTGLWAGLAPVQLTLEGYNFDIVTALTALVLYFALGANPNRTWVRAFNLMGVAFLVVIAFIALTSMPTPFRVFTNEPSNIWVTDFPYIMLPGILVLAALTGHLLIFRKLARPSAAPATVRAP